MEYIELTKWLWMIPMGWMIVDRNITVRRLIELEKEQAVLETRTDSVEEENKKVLSKLDKLLDITTSLQKDMSYQKGKDK